MDKRPSYSFLMQAGVPGEAVESALRGQKEPATDPQHPRPWWLRLKRLFRRNPEAGRPG